MQNNSRFFKLIFALAFCTVGCSLQPEDKIALAAERPPESIEAVATFAGGCFWCVEHSLDRLPGVIEVVSGFAGGTEQDAHYKIVSAGNTDHRESVQVIYDPSRISYERILGAFWRTIDPTDAQGSFVDRGKQYTSAIFYHDENQRQAAEASLKELEQLNKYGGKKVVTPILPFSTFYPAEEYHQDYHKKHPLKYSYFSRQSGRPDFLKKIWGEAELERYFTEVDPTIMNNNPRDLTALSKEELKNRLTPLQFKVTQEDATEPPFKNEYWDNHREGIYVDVVSGEALFSSRDKYDSGTGWPSFSKVMEPANVITKEDNTLFTRRIEVRSKCANSHLGHVFDDGPEPTGKRYCMNSAALRFIPLDQMESEGYAEYIKFFR